MTQPTLEQAPDEVKLAVDLICLLEDNGIDPKIALEAIKIVKSDCEAKLKQS